MRASRLVDEDGFTLLETVCALAIIVLLVSIVVPAFPRSTSKSRLEALAVQAAAILKADHQAALRRRAAVATEVSVQSHAIVSGATGRVLYLPEDVQLEAMLAGRCAEHATGASVDFLASGMSCGGVLALSRPGMRYELRVNWLTGGVEIVPQAL